MSKIEPLAWYEDHGDGTVSYGLGPPMDCENPLYPASALAAARREALEEAAKACEENYKMSGRIVALACATAIRALIEKHNGE